MSDGFFMIPNEFIEHIGRLTPLELRVLLVFKMYAGDNREAFPSAEKVAADLGLKDSRDVRRSIGALRDKGFLRLVPQEQTGGRANPNRYVVDMTPRVETPRDTPDVQEPEPADAPAETSTETRGEIPRVDLPRDKQAKQALNASETRGGLPRGESTRVESTQGEIATETRGSFPHKPGGNHPENPGGFPPPNNTNNKTINKTKEQNHAPAARATVGGQEPTGEENGTLPELAKNQPDALPPGFLRFWDAWPRNCRKAGRTKCVEVWRRRGLEEIADPIIAAVEAFKRSRDWLKESGQYIPAPLVWLHGERWEAMSAENTTTALVLSEEQRVRFLRKAAGENTQIHPSEQAAYESWRREREKSRKPQMAGVA